MFCAMKWKWTLLALLISVHVDAATKWIGTWAAAPESPSPGNARTYRNQTLRLVVHTSVAGTRARVRLSNTYGDHPIQIGAAHIARRTSGADIDPASDHTLKFHGKSTATIPAHSMIVSDPVALEVPALSDLAISLYFPESTEANTTHVLAKQTNYVSTETGDATAAASFPVGKTIRNWPFLTGVDVQSARGASIVAFGSSLTDGDGTTTDTNSRYPDVLARRLQQNAHADLGVLNEGIIGNRLLSDKLPPRFAQQFGGALGEAGLTRFDRDVLSQPGVKYVIVGLGINDIAFPGDFTSVEEMIQPDALISAYRELIKRAHRKGVRVIGSTMPPFEGSFFENPPLKFFTSEKETVRVQVNDWILKSREFDGVIDFDAAVRDPEHPTRILAAYDSGDHLHPNDAGCAAQANAIPLTLFGPQ
jgi:lysophospholipase L1-like esterase